MTGRQDAINQLFTLTLTKKIDNGILNIKVDAPRVLTGDGLQWWLQATHPQQKRAVISMDRNLKYYHGVRDDYRMWVCPACAFQLTQMTIIED